MGSVSHCYSRIRVGVLYNLHMNRRFDVHAPAVAIVGWIPFRQLDNIPNPMWRNHPRQMAFRNLFRSGNSPDLPEYLGAVDLDDLVESKNFRAALAVSRLRLRGDGVNVTLDPLPAKDYIGYTVYRLGGVAYHAKGRGDTLYHAKGIGHTRPVIERGVDWARLRVTIDFKLGKVGNFGAWVLTGHWAPSAWMELSYVVRADGSWAFEVSSSGVPSAAIYKDGRRIHRHDMLTLHRGAIDGFITAGNCAYAPPEWRQQWTS